MNILLGDSSIAFRLQARQILRAVNCRVFEAENGRQVIANSFSKQYSIKDMDLIILDYQLDDVSGLEVLDFLNCHYPDLPVIMVSEDKRIETVFNCIKAGAKDYLVKPLDEDVFISRVRYFNDKLLSDRSRGNIKSLEDTLLQEVDRCNRAKNYLSVLIFKMPKDYNADFGSGLREHITGILRKLDSVFIFNGVIVLILPLTDKSGSKIVKYKVLDIMLEAGIAYRDIVKEDFIFPGDVQDQALVKDYKSLEIKDLIMERINSITQADTCSGAL